MENTKISGKDFLNDEDYFMSVAILSSTRSKDPVLKVGACIIDNKHRLVSTGYNNMPPGGDNLPWNKTSKEDLNHKSLFVCHAEMTAILNKDNGSLNGCTLYVTHNPCNECAKAVVQSGIKQVIYCHEWHPDKPKYRAAKNILQLGEVRIRKYNGPVNSMLSKL